MNKIIKKINYFWRLLGTAASFVFFGVGGLFLSLIVFPFIFLFFRHPDKKKRAFRKTISFSFKLFFHFMHYIGLLRFKKENVETLKRDEGVMLIANHPTLIDVVAIIAYTPNASCIVKKELWKNIFMKGVIEAAGYIPNIEPEKMLKQCQKSIENGDVLVIFPEGTRTKPGFPPEFQRGAAHIALALGCPVRCVEISCHPLTLSKGVPWYRIPPRRADFVMSVKERVLEPQKLIEKGTPRPLAARQLIRHFSNEYCAHVS